MSLTLAFVIAKLEVNIEGKHGWAEKLPTWKKKNKLVTLFLGKNKPLTGYHLWLIALVTIIFHIPFLFIPWTLSIELVVLSFIIFTMLMEDFLWFVVNPYFNIKEFNKHGMEWHKEWIGPFPRFYYIFLAIFLILLAFAYFLPV